VHFLILNLSISPAAKAVKIKAMFIDFYQAAKD
jgi:hypothetical protein